MTERERLLKALENASKAADAGDQSAASDARQLATLLKNMPAESAPPQRGAFDRFARGLGSTLADTVGIVPGAVMELGNLTGITDFEDTSGANMLRRAGEGLGLTNAPGVAPEGVAGAAGAGAALAGTVAAPLMAAAGRAVPLVNQATRSGSGAVQGLPSVGQMATRNANAAPTGTLSGNFRALGQSMGAPAASRPVATGATELAAGTGAAGAGEVAREAYGENTWVAPVAEVLAGGALATAPGLAASGTRRAADTMADGPMGQAVNALRRVVELGGNKGGNTRASQSLQEAASNPVEARLRLRGRTGDSGSDAVVEDLLSAAQQTGDEGIMAIGARVRADDPRALEDWRVATNRSFNALKEQLRTATGTVDADPTAAVTTLNRIRDDAIQNMDDAATLASANAAMRIQELGPDVSPEQASSIVRRELEAAKNQSRGVQTALWESSDLPADAVVAPTGFRQWYDDSLADMNDADIANLLPASARRFFNRAVPEEPEVPQILDARGRPMREVPEEPELQPSTFGELQAIRSDMLRNARTYRGGANPDLNRARLLEEAADSISADFHDGMSGLGPEARAAYDTARQYTARYNKRFRQGAVGDLLRRTPSGADAVPEAATLSQLLSGKPIMRGIRERDLTTAVGNNPAVWGAVDDFLRHDFAQKAIQGGQLNRAAAESFMRQNEAVFRNRPNLREVFDGVISGERDAADLQLQSSELAKRLNDPKVSRAEVFMARAGQGDVSEGVARIFSATDSDAVTRQIINGLKEDGTGEALRGFKAAVNDELLTRASRRSDQLMGNDGSGEFLSGSYLRQVLGLGQDAGNAETRRIGRVVNELYSTEELAQLRRLANTAFQLERDIAVNPADQVSGDFTGRMMEFATRLTGARMGAGIARATGGAGGATLVFAGQGSNFLKEMVRRGVNDPARRMIIDALGDKDRMDVLLAGIRGEELTPNHRRTLANWIEGMGPILSDEEQSENQRVTPQPMAPMGNGPAPAPNALPQAPQMPTPSATPPPAAPTPAGAGFEDMYNRVRGR